MDQHFTLEPPVGIELDEQLAQLRERVISAMPGGRAGRRGWRLGGGIAVAVGVVVVLVLSATVGPRPSAASAAVLLRSAGDAVAATSAPVIGPGQYLRVEFREVAADEMEYEGHTVAKLDRLTDFRYIPSNTSAEWVWQRSYQPSTVFFGRDARAGFASLGEQHGFDLRAVGGRFGGQDPSDGVDVSEIPTDPLSALHFFEAQYRGPAAGRDAGIFNSIRDTLALGTAAPATQAALFGALAMVPGSVVAEREATLDGRNGVAVGHADTNGAWQQQLIFDPSTGEVIGSRTVALTAWGPVPVGTVIESSAVTTSVVDAAPAPQP